MTELPEPLVPADVDLQDFPFMPLQVARLRDSDFAAEEDPEACWYAVLLWAASWHQLPAASLPNNDTVLMKMAGLGRDTRTWKKHRDGALRGFVLCSDGRLYHKTVAEQANEAWEGKLRQRHRTFCAAVRKHNERKPDETLEIPSFEDWLNADRPERVADLVATMSHGQTGNVTTTEPQCHTETGSKGQGQGQGQGQGHPIEEPNGSFVGSAPTNGSGGLFEENEVPPDPPPPEFKPEHVVEAWNQLADECGLPRVTKLSDQRKRAVKARMREHSLDDFVTALDAIRRSTFLREGNGTWRGANFDFFIQPSSFLKLIEGHYDQPAH